MQQYVIAEVFARKTAQTPAAVLEALDLLIRSLLALGASTRDLARAISGRRLAKAS